MIRLCLYTLGYNQEERNKTYSVYKDNEVKFIFCDNESIYITYSDVDDYSVCEIKE